MLNSPVFGNHSIRIDVVVRSDYTIPLFSGAGGLVFLILLILTILYCTKFIKKKCTEGKAHEQQYEICSDLLNFRKTFTVIDKTTYT